MAPVEAIAFSLERIRRGEDTISVTGNVLRDYLTDLFPILELGTQRQDALGRAADQRRRTVRDRRRRFGTQARPAAGQGELPALGQPRRVPRPRRSASSTWRRRTGNKRAQVLADTLDRATGTFLDENKSPGPPGRRDRQPRQPLLPRPATGPQELARQTDDAELADVVRARSPTPHLRGRRRSPRSCWPCRASPADIGGYYRPDDAKATAVMTPSQTLNETLTTLVR